jgi:hypothetical protein
MHLDGLALEGTHQFGCLIHSDSTGDADDDSHISIVVQRTVDRGQGSGIRDQDGLAEP